MIRTPTAVLLAFLVLSACNKGGPQNTSEPQIRVVSEEQKQLHQLDAIDLGIGLKRAIYDAGYSCKRVTDAGFVGTWQNLDEWTAHCVYDNGAERDWAIFAGPDGSAQVRDCKDVVPSGLPKCEIKERPRGSFTFRK